MAKSFSDSEKKIIETLNSTKKLIFDGIEMEILKCCKPTTTKGEPKTDIYVKTITSDGIMEYKISLKQHNAEFIENKTSSERAKQILGGNWEEIIINATTAVNSLFENKPLIFFEKNGRVNKGCFTLGWKYELLTKKSGELSSSISLDDQQLRNIYSGEGLSDDKRNAYIDGEEVMSSGVANYILHVDPKKTLSATEIFENIVDIEDYLNNNKEIFFACKALNYRSLEKKWDGDRPLAVYVDWFVEDGKLSANIIFNKPLVTKGNEVAKKLLNALSELNVSDINDLKTNMISDCVKIYI